MELQQALPDFERHRIALFAISYDPVPVQAAFAAKHGIRLAMLSDTGGQVIAALGLQNQYIAEQAAEYGITPKPFYQGIPYPGTYLLDEQGRVVDKRFHQSYRERETGTGLLERGFRLPSSGPKTVVTGQAPGVTVRAWLDSTTYRFFQRLWLTVELAMAPGVHIYAHPSAPGLEPATVAVAPVAGVRVGEPEWPAPGTLRLPALNEEFNIYSGTAQCALPLTFHRREGDLTLAVTVQYQACTATDCWPPQRVTLEIPVRAEPHAEAVPVE